MICLYAIGNAILISETSWRGGSISSFATSSCLVIGKTTEAVEELGADSSKEDLGDGAVLMANNNEEGETSGSLHKGYI